MLVPLTPVWANRSKGSTDCGENAKTHTGQSLKATIGYSFISPDGCVIAQGTPVNLVGDPIVRKGKSEYERRD